MRLVVELEDLKTIGFAVRENRAAFEAVNRIIASSPSLTDVLGDSSREAPRPSVKALLVEALEDGQWHTTRELSSLAGADTATGLQRLRDLESAGTVECREGKRRSLEWALATAPAG